MPTSAAATRAGVDAQTDNVAQEFVICDFLARLYEASPKRLSAG